MKNYLDSRKMTSPSQTQETQKDIQVSGSDKGLTHQIKQRAFQIKLKRPREEAMENALRQLKNVSKVSVPSRSAGKLTSGQATSAKKHQKSPFYHHKES
jgi:hypothetical protein